MKGGITTIIGVILIIFVMAVLLAIVTCSNPGAQNMQWCEYIEPLLSISEAFGI